MGYSVRCGALLSRGILHYPSGDSRAKMNAKKRDLLHKCIKMKVFWPFILYCAQFALSLLFAKIGCTSTIKMKVF